MRIFFILMLTVGIFTGCSDDDDEITTEEEADETTLAVNLFMKDAMETYYLWTSELPDINYKTQYDSEEYFYSLLYEDDKWSWCTDDVDALEASFEGTETTYGWSLTFGLFSNTGTVFAIVEYVYPNTPASEAGIERGDIIVEMDNADITTDNYTDLLYSESMSITFGVLSDGSISTGTSVDLVAEELTLNPVLKTSVAEVDGHTIGYIFYAQYIENFNEALDTAFQSMVDKGVTDLVLDLRYNPGGGISAAQHLCSSVAPLDAVNNTSTLVTYEWNDELQDYFESGQIMDNLRVEFDNQVAVKMGLNTLYVLTGSGTASASELTITGLKPYMSEVICIGDTTYGKYAASITLQPEDIYSNETYYNDFNNWAIQPIVLRYANANGVTDFKDGFAPDILVYDDLFDAKPLGDVEDPLFAAAIEDITGTSVVAQKSASVPTIPHSIFDRGFSKFDKNKREMLIDNIELE